MCVKPRCVSRAQVCVEPRCVTSPGVCLGPLPLAASFTYPHLPHLPHSLKERAMKGLQEAGKVLLQKHGLINGPPSPWGGAEADSNGAESGDRKRGRERGRERERLEVGGGRWSRIG